MISLPACRWGEPRAKAMNETNRPIKSRLKTQPKRMNYGNKKKGCLIAVIIAVLLMIIVMIFCSSIKTFNPVKEEITLYPVDAVTGTPLVDYDLFEYRAITGLSGKLILAGTLRKVVYRHLGKKNKPIELSEKTYRCLNYDIFPIIARVAKECYYSLVIYKRGYLTTVWTPDMPAEVRVWPIDNENQKATLEGEIDGLLRKKPGRGNLHGKNFPLMKHAIRDNFRKSESKEDYIEVLEYVKNEYQEFLNNESLAQEVKQRVRDKVTSLHEVIKDPVDFFSYKSLRKKHDK